MKFTNAVIAPTVAFGLVIAGSMAGCKLNSDTPASAEGNLNCLKTGQKVCTVDGVTVVSLEGMPPTDHPYERCVYLLKISKRVSELAYTDDICEPLTPQKAPQH